MCQTRSSVTATGRPRLAAQEGGGIVVRLAGARQGDPVALQRRLGRLPRLERLGSKREIGPGQRGVQVHDRDRRAPGAADEAVYQERSRFG